MLKKSLVILTAASLMASASAEAAWAQSNFGGRGASSYDGGYTDGYRRGWDDFRMKRSYNDRAPPGGGAPQYLPSRDASRSNYDPRMAGDAGQRWRQQYQRQYTYQDDSFYRECRTKSDPGGIIAGALIGGLLGNALGKSGGATIAGVVVGGVAGAALTRNTSAEADMAAEAVESSGAALRRDLAAAMTGEDFGWMLAERPGAYVWIGNGPAENGVELHNPRYDYNDAILPVAAGWYAEVAKRALRG